jgi:hypothetical protein
VVRALELLRELELEELLLDEELGLLVVVIRELLLLELDREELLLLEELLFGVEVVVVDVVVLEVVVIEEPDWQATPR